MSQPKSDNIRANTPKQLDDRWGVWRNGKWTPYDDLAEFDLLWPIIVQYETQMFWVRNPDDENKADLWGLRKDLTKYKITDDSAGTGLIKIDYAELEDDHKTYVNGDLAGKPFFLFQNSISRFLETSEYTILDTGGFELLYPVDDGDHIYLFGTDISTIGGSSNDTLDAVAHRGNTTSLNLIAAPATLDIHLVTFAQLKEYAINNGFEYIDPDDDNHIEIPDSTMYKVTITEDSTIGALSASPGSKGVVISVQDDFGGHLLTLAEGNDGDPVILNTLPRSITELTFIRTDTKVYWKSRVLHPGIEPTTLPVIRIDDYYDTLEVFHSLPPSEILVSINNGPWLNWATFNQPISIGAVDRPPGYWRFKVKEGVDRLESGISYSLPTHAAKVGFPFVIPVILS